MVFIDFSGWEPPKKHPKSMPKCFRNKHGENTSQKSILAFVLASQNIRKSLQNPPKSFFSMLVWNAVWYRFLVAFWFDFGVIWGGFWGSKSVIFGIDFWSFFGLIWGSFWEALGRLWGVQIGHFGHRFVDDVCISFQERPKSGQERPRAAQERARGAQERAREAKSGPREAQERPKAAQERPKRGQKRPMSSKE